MLGDQYGIARTSNNISLIYITKDKYEDALYYVIQAYEILKKINIPDIQRSMGIISSIKNKVGPDDFGKLRKHRENNQHELNNPR